MKKLLPKILCTFLLFMLLFLQTTIYATEFIWSNYDETMLTSTNENETGNFLNLAVKFYMNTIFMRN